MSKPVILCVDDEKIVLTSLKEQLRRRLKGEYLIETVESGEEALEVVEECLEEALELPVVISDHIMPGMKGDELLREVYAMSPKTLSILLTGQASADAVGNALNRAKLYRYIAKPWEEADLILTVTEALRSYFQTQKVEEQHVALQSMNQELERLNQELKDYNLVLEEKVEERTQALNATLRKVEDANQKILESIQYAEMIQRSLLPGIDQVKQHLPQSFFCWQPRDIVGGDFFFADFTDDDGIICVIDCTGHGVPGAFMTIIASSGLRKIVKDEQCRDPAEILKHLNAFVKTTLRQHTESSESDDGLDAAICQLSFADSIMTFAGANIPLYYTQGNAVYVIKGDRHSLGYRRSDLHFHFTNHTLPLTPDITCYLSSDGFVDQLGGETARRFGSKQFKASLLESQHTSFEFREQKLLQIFQAYKGDREQQDDVTMLGFQLR